MWGSSGKTGAGRGNSRRVSEWMVVGDDAKRSGPGVALTSCGGPTRRPGSGSALRPVTLRCSGRESVRRPRPIKPSRPPTSFALGSRAGSAASRRDDRPVTRRPRSANPPGGRIARGPDGAVLVRGDEHGRFGGDHRRYIAVGHHSGDFEGNPTGDAITFDIPGPGVHTITPQTDLPSLPSDLTLDASSQPGYAGTPLIELAGNGAPYVHRGPGDRTPGGLRRHDPGPGHQPLGDRHRRVLRR